MDKPTKDNSNRTVISLDQAKKRKRFRQILEQAIAKANLLECDEPKLVSPYKK